MTLRDTYNTAKKQAARLLDDVKAGLWHPPEAITWALRVLGEPVSK